MAASGRKQPAPVPMFSRWRHGSCQVREIGRSYKQTQVGLALCGSTFRCVYLRKPYVDLLI
jgi:hypothetical protein